MIFDRLMAIPTANLPRRTQVAALILVALFVFLKANGARKTGKPIPGPRGYPIIGMLLAVRRYSKAHKMFELFDELTQKYGSLVFFKVFSMKFILTSDRTLAHRILTDTANFERGRGVGRSFRGIATDLLFAMPFGDKWKRHRKFVQPAFSPPQLREARNITEKEVDKLIDFWKTEALTEDGSAVVDIFRSMTCMTLDIIGFLAFSHEFHSVEKYHSGSHTEAQKILLDIFGVVHERLNLPPYLWPFYSIGERSPRVLAIQRYLNGLFEEIMNKKSTQSSADGSDLLDRLLLADAENNEFTKQEIFGEVVTFLLAGHETTANTLTFILLELARHEDVQMKLKSEIRAVIKSGNDLSVETLSDFKYLDCVIKEAQRLHTVTPSVGRLSLKDIEHDGYVIPAKTVVIAYIGSIHGGTLWDEPKRFKPERWLEPERIHPGSFLPFGEGPQRCIGQKMALIEMKVALIQILREFTVGNIDGQSPEIVHTITYGFKNGLNPSDDAATDRESDGSNGRLSVADDCSVDSDGFDDACARSDPALAGYQLLDDDYDPGSDKDNEDDADEVDADDRDEQLPPRPVLVAKQSDLLSNGMSILDFETAYECR
ncbi:Thromboxane-A synthase [Entophlyctis luteolus]|nr:Thromboxane-A synthase [Entophlyctis luteolus]